MLGSGSLKVSTSTAPSRSVRSSEGIGIAGRRRAADGCNETRRGRCRRDAGDCVTHPDAIPRVTPGKARPFMLECAGSKTYRDTPERMRAASTVATIGLVLWLTAPSAHALG